MASCLNKKARILSSPHWENVSLAYSTRKCSGKPNLKLRERGKRILFGRSLTILRIIKKQLSRPVGSDFPPSLKEISSQCFSVVLCTISMFGKGNIKPMPRDSVSLSRRTNSSLKCQGRTR